jgi:hypothetical protein
MKASYSIVIGFLLLSSCATSTSKPAKVATEKVAVIEPDVDTRTIAAEKIYRMEGVMADSERKDTLYKTQSADVSDPQAKSAEIETVQSCRQKYEGVYALLDASMYREMPISVKEAKDAIKIIPDIAAIEELQQLEACLTKTDQALRFYVQLDKIKPSLANFQKAIANLAR